MKFLQPLLLNLTAFYLRVTPLEKGRWRIINFCLPLLRKYGPNMGERVVRTRNGFLYRADLSDWLGQYVFLTGLYEPPTARLMTSLLNPGNNFVDVGANSGYFTLLAARKVGPSGQVISFEPLPSMRERIRQNLALNGFNNVKLHDVAVSNTNGEVEFFEGPSGHKGLSSLRPLSDSDSTLKVRTTPLDELYPDIDAVSLIKIDVEGAEQLALEGMRNLLSRHKPQLVVEITDQYLQAFGHNAQSLFAFLADLGYRSWKITDQGLVEIDWHEAEKDPQFNALFSTRDVRA